MNRKCPKCGNEMNLNVITNTWDCNNCGNQIDDNEDINVEVENINNNNDIDNQRDIINEEVNVNNSVEDNSIGNYTLCHCENCNISFIGENIDNCFICGNSLNKRKTNINYNKYLDYKLDLGDAIHNYKKKLSYRLLCPISFRGKKAIRKIKGIYIPMHLFDSSNDGEVVFNASDINYLDTSKKEKKINYFKVICKGHFDYRNVLINESSKINNTLLEKIDDFNYNELKDINGLNLGEKIIYKEDCDNYNVFERLKNRCINNSVKLMSDLVNHTKSKVVDNNLDFKYEDKGMVLVPIYFLVNKYKGKTYYYIMNGQNGNTYIKVPIGIIETVVFSILLFVILFVIMLLIAIFI